MPALQSSWLDQPIHYDGSQLRSHWILETTELVGDAVVGFRGGCDVALAEMADIADLDGPGIAGNDLVHILWESFEQPDLLLAVHRQRLLAAQAGEVVRELAPGVALRREGDDLFVGDGKLSISIATASTVSALVHFAVNATPGGAPVPTATLTELGIEPTAFGQRLLERIVDEQLTITAARAMVRAKGEWAAGRRDTAGGADR
ncbi:MAG: DUF366 family protein [bacterium]|nr:DUF366 family protein [bacterium]